MPILLIHWGKEKYGIWITVSSFYTLVQVLDIGHQNYIGNEFIKLFHQNKQAAKQLISSSIVMSVLIGLFEIIFVLLVISFSRLHELLGVSAHTANNEQLNLSVFVLVATWVLVGSVGGILVRMIIPLGLMATFIHFGTVIRVLLLAILVVGGYFNLTIFQICLINSIIVIGYNLCLFLYVKIKLPEFFPWWQGYNFKLGLSNWMKSLVLTINTILDQLSNNGLIILISRFLGATFVPLFSTQRTVANVSQQGVSLFVQPVQPELIKYHVTNNGKLLKHTLFISWIFLLGIINVFITISIPFIPAVFKLWTQNQLIYNEALMLLLIASSAITCFSRILFVYLSGINDLKSISVITTLRFVVLFSILLVFLKTFGLIALGIGLLVSESLVLAVAFFLTNTQLRKISSTLSALDVIRYVTPLAIFLVNLWLIYNSAHKQFLSFSAAFAQILVVLLLFVKLDADIKRQIQAFIKSKIQRLFTLIRFKSTAKVV